MNKRIFNIPVSVIMITVVAVLASCKGSTKEQAPAKEETHAENTPDTVELTSAQSQTIGLQLGKLTPRQISGAVKVNGLLDVPPQQLVSIAVPMGGFIKNTALLQGMPVKKGQVIATLENMDYIQLQQDYLDQKSQLEYAKVEHERQQELSRENVNALKTLQQAKATHQSLSVRVNALKEKLKLLNINLPALENGTIQPAISIYAPISGYVTQVNVNIGQFVNPQDVLFRIVNTAHLHAELTVFEKDVPRLKEGQKVRFTLANETTERTATVHLIGREISEERTIRVHCHLDQEDLQLLPGTYLQAMIETGAMPVKALPDDAIVSFDNRHYIFAQSGPSRFAMVPVQKGNSEMGYTEVTPQGELDINTPVVVKGAYDLLAKLKNSEETGGHGH